MNEELFIKFCEKYNIIFRHKDVFKIINSEEQMQLFEFLGDSFINFLITNEIFRRNHKKLGEKAKIKSYLISGFTLSSLAQEIGLKDILPQNQRTIRKSEDFLESFLGLLFWDRGYLYAKRILLMFFHDKLITAQQDYKYFDYKSQLQEYSQKEYGTVPKYRIIKSTGPDHKKIFSVNVCIGKDIKGSGIGNTIKEAHQKAAKEALDSFNVSKGVITNVD